MKLLQLSHSVSSEICERKTELEFVFTILLFSAQNVNKFIRWKVKLILHQTCSPVCDWNKVEAWFWILCHFRCLIKCVCWCWFDWGNSNLCIFHFAQFLQLKFHFAQRICSNQWSNSSSIGDSFLVQFL